MTYLVQRLKHGVHFFQDCGNGVQAQEPLDDIMVDEGDLVRQAKDCLPFRQRNLDNLRHEGQVVAGVDQSEKPL